MKESLLWGRLKPELARFGKFQKISDRFTPGVPDVLGCFLSTGYALELKELKGVRVLRAEFRPGQLDWLTDWRDSGGVSLIISSWGRQVLVHTPEHGPLMEQGSSWENLKERSVFLGPKPWRAVAHQILLEGLETRLLTKKGEN